LTVETVLEILLILKEDIKEALEIEQPWKGGQKGIRQQRQHHFSTQHKR